jgi:hypothetical protein
VVEPKNNAKKDEDEKIDVNLTIGKRPASESDINRVTSIRKGMGKAKYSSLITTIPSEMCKELDIKAGDSMFWSLPKGSNVMTATKASPGLAENQPVLLTIIDMLLKDKNAKGAFSEGDRKTLERLLKASEPIKRLSKEELYAEMHKMREKIRKKIKEENTREDAK